MSKKILMILNGVVIDNAELVKKLAMESNMIICADAGANYAKKFGLEPNFIIGDFDSISDETKNHFKDKTTFIPTMEPNYTDFEKAVVFAIENDAGEITVLGATGRRFDHTIANLSIMKKYANKVQIKFIDDFCETSMVSKDIKFEGEIGQKISIIPLGRTEGITTEGLKYNLKNEPLQFGGMGVGNEILSNPVKIKIKKGDLILFKVFEK